MLNPDGKEGKENVSINRIVDEPKITPSLTLRAGIILYSSSESQLRFALGGAHTFTNNGHNSTPFDDSEAFRVEGWIHFYNPKEKHAANRIQVGYFYEEQTKGGDKLTQGLMIRLRADLRPYEY